MASQFGQEEIERRLGYHRVTEQTLPKHRMIRKNFIDLANEIGGILPDTREKALFLTSLQEAAMWANAAVATNEAPLTLDQ